MSTPQQQLIPYIHHEKQEKGSMLCAQHALNCLLQGQYYDASQLAQIAGELDELEASQLGLSQAAIASRDASSLNMDDTGFFSASVLEKALQVWGLTITNWRSAEMRSRQQAPEDEKAFILNLNSHWFTIRAFGTTSKFWYNLNSFLPEPAWIGNNYLGTLLHTAESEGYSVFVVYPSEGSTGQGLQESDADQIADHLPAPGGSSSTSDSTNGSHASSVLGLRPKDHATSTSSTTASGMHAADFGLSDEDRELQAALSASLAQSTAPPTSAFNLDSPSGRSRVRHTRSGSDDGSLVGAGAGSGLETDADIDAIAPSRRRQKAEQQYDSGIALPSSSASSDSRGNHRFDPVDEDLRRAMEASLTGSSHPSSSAGSSTAIELGSSGSAVAISSSSSSSASRPMGRRKRRAQEQRSGLSRDDAIDLEDSQGPDSADEIEELRPASLHRSPFLSPAMLAANRDNEDVEEIIDDDDDDDDLRVDPFSIRGAPEASAVIGPRQDRHYDDEDAELQAALAASLGDTEAASRLLASGTSLRQSSARAAAEEKEGIPADVDRIFRMREEAKKKAQLDREIQERRDRGEIVPEQSHAESSAKTTTADSKSTTNKDDDEQEEEEEEAEEEVSPEEMRRRRLARFG